MEEAVVAALKNKVSDENIGNVPNNLMEENDTRSVTYFTYNVKINFIKEPAIGKEIHFEEIIFI